MMMILDQEGLVTASLNALSSCFRFDQVGMGIVPLFLLKA